MQSADRKTLWQCHKLLSNIVYLGHPNNSGYCYVTTPNPFCIVLSFRLRLRIMTPLLLLLLITLVVQVQLALWRYVPIPITMYNRSQRTDVIMRERAPLLKVCCSRGELRSGDYILDQMPIHSLFYTRIYVIADIRPHYEYYIRQAENNVNFQSDLQVQNLQLSPIAMNKAEPD